MVQALLCIAAPPPEIARAVRPLLGPEENRGLRDIKACHKRPRAVLWSLLEETDTLHRSPRAASAVVPR
jgi:hypothetical protein